MKLRHWTTLALLAIFGAAAAMAQDVSKEKMAYLGVYLGSVEHIHERHGLHEKTEPTTQGAVVTEVVEGSAAESAGLLPHDVIVAVNDTPVESSRGLTEALKGYQPNDRVTLRVLRDGAEMPIQAILGERPAVAAKLIPRHNKWLYAWRETPFVGVKMQELNGQLAEFFGVEGGILITEVVADSPAARAGLKAGDVLINWNGAIMQGPSDLTADLRDSKENDIVLATVVRKGETRDLEVTLGAPKQRAWPTMGDHGLLELQSPEVLHEHLQMLENGKPRFEFKNRQRLIEEIESLKQELEKRHESKKEGNLE